MDIARLLSPCSDPSPPPDQHESSGSEENVDGSSSSAIAASTHSDVTARKALGQQLVPLDELPPSSVVTAQRRTAPTALTASPTTSFPAKRKRKRRFSAQQKQVMREKEEDDSRIYNLALDVNELKQQIRDLSVRRSIIETRTLVSQQRFNAGVVRTTQLFFQVLQRGFREWGDLENAFLTATVDQDITIASGVRGASAFFEQWRRYTKLFQLSSITISSIRIVSSDSESCVVECKGEFEGKLTLAAIAAVFPHILEDTELLGRVVNSRLVCPRTDFVYFDSSGRVVQYEANVDFFAALSGILATSPKDVITLMSNSRISSEGSLIPGPGD